MNNYKCMDNTKKIQSMDIGSRKEREEVHFMVIEFQLEQNWNDYIHQMQKQRAHNLGKNHAFMSDHGSYTIQKWNKILQNLQPTTHSKTLCYDKMCKNKLNCINSDYKNIFNHYQTISHFPTWLSICWCKNCVKIIFWETARA
jgi:hypothetical protein